MNAKANHNFYVKTDPADEPADGRPLQPADLAKMAEFAHNHLNVEIEDTFRVTYFFSSAEARSEFMADANKPKETT